MPLCFLASDGSITEAGRGTRFEIWLPVVGEISTPAVEEARTLPRGNGDIVMIVDDEREVLRKPLHSRDLAESLARVLKSVH